MSWGFFWPNLARLWPNPATTGHIRPRFSGLAKPLCVLKPFPPPLTGTSASWVINYFSFFQAITNPKRQEDPALASLAFRVDFHGWWLTESYD
jgi:hypothetical protein